MLPSRRNKKSGEDDDSIILTDAYSHEPCVPQFLAHKDVVGISDTMQLQVDFLNNIQACLDIQFKNIASSRDKLSNLIYDILKIVDDDYVLYEKSNATYDLAEGLHDIWLLFESTPNDFWAKYVEHKIREERFNIINKLKEWVMEIWQGEASDVKTKLPLLVYYVLIFFSDSYKLLPIENPHVNILDNTIGELWFEFLEVRGEKSG